MTTVLEHPGGCEKYMIETATSLSKRRNIEIDIITMDEHFMDFLGFWLHLLRFNKKRDRSHFRQSEDVVKQLGKVHYYKIHKFKSLRQLLQNYDVIYSKNELLEVSIFKFILGYKNLPPILLGGHTPLRYPKPKSLQSKLHNFLYSGNVYQILGSGVKKFHAINGYDGRLYTSLFPNREVQVIANPFDLIVFNHQAKKYDASIYKFDKSKINILWVGRLTEQKGIEDLCKIVKSINKNIQIKIQIVWNICGAGELKQEIIELMKQEKNVNYMGYVDQGLMPGIYKNNQIFLSTSKWESYQYTLVEAQAAGLDIFAYNIDITREMVNDYSRAWLANNLNDMITLLSSGLSSYRQNKYPRHSSLIHTYDPIVIYDQLAKLIERTAYFA
jgi:glycosyltransferase involved in cell wall biosynthesis